MTELSGYLIINKPAGPTSHDVIDVLRQITGLKKIGHAGTLDPFAGGILIAGIGRAATRHLSAFSRMDKKYRAVLRLGGISDTYDLTGKIKIIKTQELRIKNKELRINQAAASFIGRQKQMPPIYSAKIIKGQRAYNLARQGEKITLLPQEIEIYDIKIIKNLKLKIKNFLILDIHCSSGTYIRSLAHDIGQQLGCGAYLEKLVRLSIDNFTLSESVNLPLPLFKHSQPNYAINNNLTPNLPQPAPIITPANWMDHLINFKQILCFGTFDILHPGHFYFLKQAKSIGNRLTVIVARDIISSKIKNRKPTHNEQQRISQLKKISFIDEIRLGDLANPYKCLSGIKPDLICLGYDQTSFTSGLSDEIKKLKLKTKICRLTAFQPKKYKSSILKKDYK